MSDVFALNPSPNSFEYPFRHIRENDSLFDDVFLLENIFRRMPFQKTIDYKDVGDFPNNISEYIFGRGGDIYDNLPWQLLGKLDNGLYFWIDASCCYSGFYCQGNMCLFASTNLKYIVDYAMCRFEREALHSCLEKRYLFCGRFSSQTEDALMDC